MNKLYSLLLGDATIPAAYSWYAKRTESIPVTQRMEAIIALITAEVPTERLALYASTVCNLVLYTQFGAEIKQLDPNNTYFPVVRYPEAEHSDLDYGMTDLIKPIDTYKELSLYLATDISDRVDNKSWIDLIGAGCLQLLRDAI